MICPFWSKSSVKTCVKWEEEALQALLLPPKLSNNVHTADNLSAGRRKVEVLRRGMKKKKIKK